MGQTAEIAARTGATVIAAAELGGYIAQRVVALGGSRKQVWGGAISGRKKVSATSRSSFSRRSTAPAMR